MRVCVCVCVCHRYPSIHHCEGLWLERVFHDAHRSVRPGPGPAVTHDQPAQSGAEGPAARRESEEAGQLSVVTACSCERASYALAGTTLRVMAQKKQYIACRGRLTRPQAVSRIGTLGDPAGRTRPGARGAGRVSARGRALMGPRQAAHVHVQCMSTLVCESVV